MDFGNSEEKAKGSEKRDLEITGLKTSAECLAVRPLCLPTEMTREVILSFHQKVPELDSRAKFPKALK